MEPLVLGVALQIQTNVFLRLLLTALAVTLAVAAVGWKTEHYIWRAATTLPTFGLFGLSIGDVVLGTEPTTRFATGMFGVDLLFALWGVAVLVTSPWAVARARSAEAAGV